MEVCFVIDLPSSLTLASVWGDVVKTTEDLEGRVTLDAVILAEIGLLSAVDLGEPDVLLLESGSSLLVLGGEGLAVTAPGSEDYKNETRWSVPIPLLLFLETCKRWG